MSSGESNRRYDEEIERRLKTEPIDEMPDFEPKISASQVEELAHLPEESRSLILPVLRALSISEQRVVHVFRLLVIANGSIREIERKNLDKKTKLEEVGIWLLAGIVGAILSALAFKYLHVSP